MNNADPNDFASDLEQRERDAGLAAVRSQLGAALLPVGTCYNCDSDLPAGQVFCPRLPGEHHCCRSDYERRKANGRG